MTDREILERTDDAAPEQAQAALPDEPYYQRTPQPAQPALPDEPYYQRTPQQASSGARLGRLLVIIGLIWLAIELLGYGPFFSGSQTSTTIPAPLPGNRLELDLGAGDVEIRTAAGPDIQVELTQYGIWQGDPLAISQLGDRALLRNEARSRAFGLCFGRCGQSYTVTAPADVNLLVKTSSGDISIAGAEGEVVLASSSGDVTAEDIANGITVSTSSGEITLSRVSGQLEAQTSSGDVELKQGQVVDASVHTSSGEIELDGVAGTLTLQSDSGDVRVRNAQNGQLTLQTSSGGVDYTGDLAGDSTITTSSGDVELHLPADSSFVLEARTSSGDLGSDFELRDRQQSERALSGTAGQGGAALEITTGSGDISIER